MVLKEMINVLLKVMCIRGK